MTKETAEGRFKIEAIFYVDNCVEAKLVTAYTLDYAEAKKVASFARSMIASLGNSKRTGEGTLDDVRIYERVESDWFYVPPQ